MLQTSAWVRLQVLFIGSHAQSLRFVQLFETPWTLARQNPLSQARILEWVAISISRGYSRPWDQTCVSRVPPELQADSLALSHRVLGGNLLEPELSEGLVDYFANKGPSSQGYGFSSSRVWMWELDYKESWALKNWCFWTVVLEKTLESPLDCNKIQPVHLKGNQSWMFIGKTDVEAETPILWPSDAKSWLIWKDPYSGKDWRWEEKGMTEDEMVGCHHRLNEYEFESTLGVGDGQEGLACCDSWGHKESDTIERLNWTEWMSHQDDWQYSAPIKTDQCVGVPRQMRKVGLVKWDMDGYQWASWVRAAKNYSLGFPSGASGNELACQCRRQDMQGRSLGWEDPLEEGMAIYSSILAWRIPWTEGVWWATVQRVKKSCTWPKWLGMHIYFPLKCLSIKHTATVYSGMAGHVGEPRDTK